MHSTAAAAASAGHERLQQAASMLNATMKVTEGHCKVVRQQNM
jgi:hypothetical protein